MRKALVTGGTGEIGREIVRELLCDGFDVTIFNRGQHVDPPPDNVRVIIGDRYDYKRFQDQMAEERFDIVYDMLSFNVRDAISAVRAFQDRVDLFIHCSSVMTFGPPFENNGIGVKESAPLNGTSDYALGKIAADSFLLDAYRRIQFPVIIIKPSYTHGPGRILLRQVRCEGEWIDRLRKGKPIISVGDGLNCFQFLSSRDAGRGFVNAVYNRDSFLGNAVNLVHPRAMTWDEWHNTAAEVLGVKADIVHIPQDVLLDWAPDRYYRLTDNFGYTQVFDGSIMENAVFGFKPRVPVTESVAENIEWMDKHGLVPDCDSQTNYFLEDRIIEKYREAVRIDGT